MKLRKLTALLLGAAVLASAAVPMASAEAANVNINVQPELFSPNAGISESFSEDGAVTLTIDDATASGTGGLMMWPDYANEENTDNVVNLAETPYLCWEVTGTANFGFAIRWDRNEGNEDTCYRFHNVRGHETDGVAPQKGSENFLELLKNNDIGLVYTKDEIKMIATVLNVCGDAGDSATIKLYFSANPVDQQQEPSDQTEDDKPATTTTTADEPADTTAPTANTTTKKNNPSTGEASQAAAAAVVLAVAATGAVVLMKKKNG